MSFLKLSGEAMRLVSTFFAYRNDIDIYTEDEPKDKEFYRIIFSRLMGDSIKIADITPLGCKKNVVERCENEPINGRKKIFIVDGDVSIIHGKPIPPLPNLFILNKYCIENYLMSKASIVHLSYMRCASKAKEAVEAEVDFDNWVIPYTNNLVNLFLHFALLDFFLGNFTLYSAGKYHTHSHGEYSFNEGLVALDILAIKNEILQTVSEKDYQTKLSELENKWPRNTDTFFTIASGKDYLIPIALILSQKIRKNKSQLSTEEAKFQLAHFCCLQALEPLKIEIQKICA